MLNHIYTRLKLFRHARVWETLDFTAHLKYLQILIDFLLFVFNTMVIKWLEI